MFEKGRKVGWSTGELVKKIVHFSKNVDFFNILQICDLKFFYILKPAI
jgi:hypothetical protein